MSKRLRDGVMRFRLHIHSRWMMKTHWRAQSQRNHSGGSTPRTKYDSGQESLVTMNEQAEALHSSTTSVRRNAARTSYYTLSFGACIHTSSSYGFSVCRCCQDINAGLHIQSTGLLQRTAVWRVWRADVSSTIGPERRRATCNRRAAAWQHHARRFYDSSTGYPCVNEWPSRSPSWSSSVWLSRHRRIWQTTFSLLPTSARAVSDRPTQRCASSDVQITVSATGVLRLLDHACGTRCQCIYGSATVSDSWNGCWRPICSVFGTAALCGALVRSAV